MRISIHDLSDSDDEPIVVLPAVGAAPNEDEDDGDGSQLQTSPTARKNRSAHARSASLLAGRLSSKLSLGALSLSVEDEEVDEDELEIDPAELSITDKVLSMRQGSASISTSRDVPSSGAHAAQPGPLAFGDRRRSASVEPSRPVKRGYTPYWTTTPAPSERTAADGDNDPPLDVLSSSPSSAGDEDLDLSSGDDDVDVSEDSEEEQWPVNPRGYGASKAADDGRGRGRRRRSRKAQSRPGDDEEVLRRIRLSAVPDLGSKKAAKESVWAVATGRYHAQARAFAQTRNSPSPAAANARAFGLRKAGTTPTPTPTPTKRRTPFGLSVVSEEASRQPSSAINEVQNLLRELHMRRDEDERRLQNEFETRSKQLWDSIEASIREAERKNEAEAAEKTAVLIAKRREQEANEKAAREAREAEERRIAEEKERARLAAEEAKRKEEEQRKRREAEAAEEERQRQKEAEANAANSMGGTAGSALWAQSKADYARWYQHIQDIKNNVLPQVSSNPDWRKQCFMAKRQITPKIGQLTNSRSEIVRITLSIGDVLSQAKSANPAIYTWILNHLAKCLIRQAEQEVAAKLSTAFPLARVVVWLIFSGHSELGDVLMARLVKKCCYLVGCWPAKRETQSDAEYRKQLGRPSSEETTHAFNSRMSGIFALYCAILQTVPTAPPTASGGQAPLNLELMPAQFRTERLWIWQARALNKPMSDHPLTPTLLATCFEVAGKRAQAYYGRQMAKLWRVLLVEGIRGHRAGFVSKYVGPGVDPNAEDGGAKAASARLQLLLEEWEKKGVVQGNPAADQMDP
ncbi:Nuclear pore complex nucleoporin component [Tilletia horrida]|uniref:mRNA export factor GLE1 n=1 Tax=Tilletia horrida TaxID=155126 RepID=A0AAN6GGI5_9BASI|nr:Nuclear pore complex nucleoporin component [Tilletia horrida]